MEKTATLNVRVSPAIKQQAEEILSRLGVPMSTAIDMYLNQISLTGGIPFAVTLPKAPAVINADLMSNAELHEKLQRGYDNIKAGKVQNAAEAFAQFRGTHADETVYG
ncbi:MAG: type II toxin-antitoxin system RelB/DinJ family antitoxin [Lachnospiraceae bacterium]|nr:type II toxin-antitoxin system RelB/DinJ family antitoxin [Lachnospiraceae bacterium]